MGNSPPSWAPLPRLGLKCNKNEVPSSAKYDPYILPTRPPCKADRERGPKLQITAVVSFSRLLFWWRKGLLWLLCPLKILCCALFATVLISRTNTYAQTGLTVYFLPADIKNRISPLHNRTVDCNYCTWKLSLLISNRQFIRTWAKRGVVSTAANESILPPLSKQTELFYPPCVMKHFGLLPRQ